MTYFDGVRQEQADHVALAHALARVEHLGRAVDGRVKLAVGVAPTVGLREEEDLFGRCVGARLQQFAQVLEAHSVSLG